MVNYSSLNRIALTFVESMFDAAVQQYRAHCSASNYTELEKAMLLFQQARQVLDGPFDTRTGTPTRIDHMDTLTYLQDHPMSEWADALIRAVTKGAHGNLTTLHGEALRLAAQRLAAQHHAPKPAAKPAPVKFAVGTGDLPVAPDLQEDPSTEGLGLVPFGALAVGECFKFAGRMWEKVSAKRGQSVDRNTRIEYAFYNPALPVAPVSRDYAEKFQPESGTINGLPDSQ